MDAPERRLRGLLEAGIALSAELSLEALLQKLVETAAALTGARYAALGVIDANGKRLEQFVAWGIDEPTRAKIGDLPSGRGILGVLINDAKPLRLHDLTEDSRSVGFPPYHPPMRTFLGVPILLRGVAYGNLYLTEKKGGADFDHEDEEIVRLLAAQAAVGVENARLYEAAALWSRQLESLNEIGAALTTETELPRLLELIARRLGELIRARIVTIATPGPDGALRIRAAHGDHASTYVGHVLERGRSKSGHVLERGRAERVDALAADPEIDQEAVHQLGATTGLYVPLVVRGRTIGVVAAHDKLGADPRFSPDDQRLAEAFAARAAVAVNLSERIARDSLRRALAAQELERRRLSLELHDETGQALTSILLGLRAVEEARNDEELRSSAAALRELVVETLRDVRRLALELRPKALDDFGLLAALERLAGTFSEQTGITVDVESRLAARLPSEVETALYRIIQEALTNIVKHAQARNVSILLTGRNQGVTAVIEDDGRGFSPADEDGDGLGLVGMRERVSLLDGRLEIESTEGAGTTLVVEVPIP